MKGRTDKSVVEMLDIMTEWGEGVIALSNSSYRMIVSVLAKVGRFVECDK